MALAGPAGALACAAGLDALRCRTAARAGSQNASVYPSVAPVRRVSVSPSHLSAESSLGARSPATGPPFDGDSPGDPGGEAPLDRDEVDSETIADIREARAAVIRAQVQAQNEHDVKELTRLTWLSTCYKLSSLSGCGEVPDVESARELYLNLFAAFPDFAVQLDDLRHGDNHVLVQARISGTQAQDWAGILNTGKNFSTAVAAVYEFNRATLLAERVYLDLGEIVRQLASQLN
jgi:predicted ester cyclase